MKSKIIILIVIIIIAFVGFIIINQFLILQKAHRTFENYYSFRGCTQLIEKTDAYGICKTSSGETIKIVEIKDKWYLEGDGPGIW